MTAFSATVDGLATVTPPALFRDNTTRPANDNFASAAPVVFDVPIHGRMVGTTVEATEFDSLGADSGGVLRSMYSYTSWYRVDSPREDTLNIDFSSDADSLFLVAWYGPFSGDPATMSNLIQAVSAQQANTPSSLIAHAGKPVYLQVIQPHDDNTAGGPGLADFDLRASIKHDPPDLEAQVDAMSSVTGQLSMPFQMAVRIAGRSSAVGTLARNSSYAAVAGAATVATSLQIDANPRVDGRIGSGVTVFELVDDQDEARVEQFINLLTVDAHSDGRDGFAGAPLQDSVDHSVERWMRIRFQPPFGQVRDLRVWCENVLAPGWAVRFGASSNPATPSSELSTIATVALPGADPGQANLLSGPLRGDQDGFSLWIVLQACVDPAVAGPQPIGYASESWSAVPIELRFAWTET